jgi:hypothetical protein
MKKYILLLIVLVLFTACPLIELYSRIKFINNSNHVVRFEMSFNYPDTLIPNEFTGLAVCQGGKDCFNTFKNEEWKNSLAQLKKDTLIFFAIHGDTSAKYGAYKARQDYRILKRYLVHVKDLEKMNYTITYP